MVSSSSGLGRLVLIQKIAGSTPAEITSNKRSPLWAYFVAGNFSAGGEPRVRTERSEVPPPAEITTGSSESFLHEKTPGLPAFLGGYFASIFSIACSARDKDSASSYIALAIIAVRG